MHAYIFILFIKRDILGVFAADMVPSRISKLPSLIVANTDISTLPGRHWIAMYIGNDGAGYYFHSLGRPPQQYFLNFMKGNSHSWICNTNQIQSLTSYVYGHYCSAFAYFVCRGKSMNTFLLNFKRDRYLNDLDVKRFVEKNIDRCIASK